MGDLWQGDGWRSEVLETTVHYPLHGVFGCSLTQGNGVLETAVYQLFRRSSTAVWTRDWQSLEAAVNQHYTISTGCPCPWLFWDQGMGPRHLKLQCIVSRSMAVLGPEERCQVLETAVHQLFISMRVVLLCNQEIGTRHLKLQFINSTGSLLILNHSCNI